MKFDYVIGNPPYQDQRGGTKNIDIWPDFVFGASEIGENSCFIHPGRWVVPKKNMSKVRDSLIEHHLKKFRLFPDSNDLFPTLRGVDGGITMTFFDKSFDGDIKFSINNDKVEKSYNPSEKIFLNNFEEEAYIKIFDKVNSTKTMMDRILGSVGSLGSTEFGYDKPKHIDLIKQTSDGMKEPIKIWANTGFGKGCHYKWGYIEKSELGKYPDKLFSSRKVIISKVGGPITNQGPTPVFNNLPEIADKNSVAENCFLCYPKTDKDRDLLLIKSLFMTKTARFLMTITQKDIYVRGFENIPDYLELSKQLPKNELFTDEWFYTTFNFSDDLITHIETYIRQKVDK